MDAVAQSLKDERIAEEMRKKQEALELKLAAINYRREQDFDDLIAAQRQRIQVLQAKAPKPPKPPSARQRDRDVIKALEEKRRIAIGHVNQQADRVGQLLGAYGDDAEKFIEEKRRMTSAVTAAWLAGAPPEAREFVFGDPKPLPSMSGASTRSASRERPETTKPQAGAGDVDARLAATARFAARPLNRHKTNVVEAARLLYEAQLARRAAAAAPGISRPRDHSAPPAPFGASAPSAAVPSTALATTAALMRGALSNLDSAAAAADPAGAASRGGVLSSLLDRSMPRMRPATRAEAAGLQTVDPSALFAGGHDGPSNWRHKQPPVVSLADIAAATDDAAALSAAAIVTTDDVALFQSLEGPPVARRGYLADAAEHHDDDRGAGPNSVYPPTDTRRSVRRASAVDDVLASISAQTAQLAARTRGASHPSPPSSMFSSAVRGGAGGRAIGPMDGDTWGDFGASSPLSYMGDTRFLAGSIGLASVDQRLSPRPGQHDGAASSCDGDSVDGTQPKPSPPSLSHLPTNPQRGTAQGGQSSQTPPLRGYERAQHDGGVGYDEDEYGAHGDHAYSYNDMQSYRGHTGALGARSLSPWATATALREAIRDGPPIKSLMQPFDIMEQKFRTFDATIRAVWDSVAPGQAPPPDDADGEGQSLDESNSRSRDGSVDGREVGAPGVQDGGGDSRRGTDDDDGDVGDDDHDDDKAGFARAAPPLLQARGSRHHPSSPQGSRAAAGYHAHPSTSPPVRHSAGASASPPPPPPEGTGSRSPPSLRPRPEPLDERFAHSEWSPSRVSNRLSFGSPSPRPPAPSPSPPPFDVMNTVDAWVDRVTTRHNVRLDAIDRATERQKIEIDARRVVQRVTKDVAYLREKSIMMEGPRSYLCLPPPATAHECGHAYVHAREALHAGGPPAAGGGCPFGNSEGDGIVGRLLAQAATLPPRRYDARAGSESGGSVGILDEDHDGASVPPHKTITGGYAPYLRGELSGDAYTVGGSAGRPLGPAGAAPHSGRFDRAVPPVYSHQFGNSSSTRAAGGLSAGGPPPRAGAQHLPLGGQERHDDLSLFARRVGPAADPAVIRRLLANEKQRLHAAATTSGTSKGVLKGVNGRPGSFEYVPLVQRRSGK